MARDPSTASLYSIDVSLPGEEPNCCVTCCKATAEGVVSVLAAILALVVLVILLPFVVLLCLMAIPMLYAFLVVNIYLRHGAELCSLKLHNLIWYKYRWRMVVPIILVLGLVFTYGLLVHPILVSTVFVPNLALAESGEPLDTAKLAMLFSPTVILLILLPALVLFFGVPGRISSQEFTTVGNAYRYTHIRATAANALTLFAIALEIPQLLGLIFVNTDGSWPWFFRFDRWFSWFVLDGIGGKGFQGAHLSLMVLVVVSIVYIATGATCVIIVHLYDSISSRRRDVVDDSDEYDNTPSACLQCARRSFRWDDTVRRMRYFVDLSFNVDKSFAAKGLLEFFAITLNLLIVYTMMKPFDCVWMDDLQANVVVHAPGVECYSSFYHRMTTSASLTLLCSYWPITIVVASVLSEKTLNSPNKDVRISERFLLNTTVWRVVIAFSRFGTGSKPLLHNLICFVVSLILLRNCIAWRPHSVTRVTRVRAAGYALCVVAALGCFVMNVMPPRDQISALEPTWSARGVCFDNTTDGCAEGVHEMRVLSVGHNAEGSVFVLARDGRLFDFDLSLENMCTQQLDATGNDLCRVCACLRPVGWHVDLPDNADVPVTLVAPSVRVARANPGEGEPEAPPPSDEGEWDSELAIVDGRGFVFAWRPEDGSEITRLFHADDLGGTNGTELLAYAFWRREALALTRHPSDGAFLLWSLHVNNDRDAVTVTGWQALDIPTNTAASGVAMALRESEVILDGETTRHDVLAIVIGDGSGACDLTAGEVAGGGPAQNMRRAEGKVLRFALADAAAGGGGGGAAGNRSLASLETDLVFTHSGNPWYSTADPWRFPNHVSALGVEGVRACFTHNRHSHEVFCATHGDTSLESVFKINSGDNLGWCFAEGGLCWPRFVPGDDDGSAPVARRGGRVVSVRDDDDDDLPATDFPTFEPGYTGGDAILGITCDISDLHLVARNEREPIFRYCHGPGEEVCSSELQEASLGRFGSHLAGAAVYHGPVETFHGVVVVADADSYAWWVLVEATDLRFIFTFLPLMLVILGTLLVILVFCLCADSRLEYFNDERKTALAKELQRDVGDHVDAFAHPITAVADVIRETASPALASEFANMTRERQSGWTKACRFVDVGSMRGDEKAAFLASLERSGNELYHFDANHDYFLLILFKHLVTYFCRVLDVDRKNYPESLWLQIFFREIQWRGRFLNILHHQRDRVNVILRDSDSGSFSSSRSRASHGSSSGGGSGGGGGGGARDASGAAGVGRGYYSGPHHSMDSSSDGLARILGHHEVRPRPRAVRGGGIGGSAASKLRRRKTSNIGDDGTWSGERLSWVEGVKHVITIAQNMTDSAPRRWLEVLLEEDRDAFERSPVVDWEAVVTPRDILVILTALTTLTPDGGGSGGEAVAEEEDLMASVTARVGAALRNPQVRLAAAELEGIQKHKAIIDLRLFEEGNDDVAPEVNNLRDDEAEEEDILTAATGALVKTLRGDTGTVSAKPVFSVVPASLLSVMSGAAERNSKAGSGVLGLGTVTLVESAPQLSLLGNQAANARHHEYVLGMPVSTLVAHLDALDGSERLDDGFSRGVRDRSDIKVVDVRLASGGMVAGEAAAGGRIAPSARGPRRKRRFIVSSSLRVVDRHPDVGSALERGRTVVTIASERRLARVIINNPVEPDDVRSFLQTATILQQLQHNNLAKYVAVSVDHACLVNYVVVNWTKTLARALDEQPDRSWNDRLRAMSEVVAGVEHLHSRGLVHGHLHWDNAFIHSEVLLFPIVVSNFGFADENPRSAAEVAPELQPFYAAEVFEGEGADTRSDSYSFAVLLCAVMAGRLSVVDDVAPWEHSAVARMSDVALLVCDALSEAPVDRPALREFLDALHSQLYLTMTMF